MASRQEEKRRRREERLAREAAAARAEAVRRRLRLVGGALVAVVAAGVVVVAASGLGGDGPGDADGARTVNEEGLPALPPQQIGDLEPAAKAAGCELVDPADEGAQHEDRTFTPADYKSNPPTSGTHNPMPADDGVYAPGNPPDLGMSVHSLEHSRIHVQYPRGTPPATVAKLEAFLAESDGYHMLLYENATGMPYQVAATAWNHSIGCRRYDDKVLDALRTFRTRYIDQGPERVP